MAIARCELSLSSGFGNFGQSESMCVPGISLKLKKDGFIQTNKYSQRCKRNHHISAQYEGRRSSRGGDFLAGFILGGAVFGTLGCLLAPQIKSYFGEKQKELNNMRINVDDDEAIENTRKNLNEKIAKLNAAIDNVAAQLKAENGIAFSDENVAKVESTS